MCQPGMTDVAKSNDTMRVDREHQRRRDAGQDQVGHFVVLPVAGRTAPAEAQDAEESAGAGRSARSRSVARSGIRPMNQNSADT